MNTRSVRFILGLLTSGLCLLFSSGCSSTPGDAASTLGPVIAEVAQARIAQVILDKNPDAEGKLLAVAAALDAIGDSATVNEITEAAVRAFVADRAAAWKLLPGEQELLVSGLLLARDQFIRNTGAAVILTNDPRVGIWVGAIKRGITSGVAAHHAAGK